MNADRRSPVSDGTPTVGIVGLGLIGGCLAIDLSRLGYRVYGVARRQATLDKAKAQGIIAAGSCELELLAEADTVFVCTPMAAIVPTVEQLSQVLTPDTVVTDVGSVKAEIVAAATALWPRFVGSHPMAGKAEAGLEAAEAGLFDQRPYVVTPIAATEPDAVEQICAIAARLKAHLYSASPQMHDRAVAAISHMPVMVSASLIQTCTQTPDRELQELTKHLASSGFRDTSRVGGGNPELGRMMAQYNRGALLEVLQQYRQELDGLIELIETEQWQLLENQLAESQQARPEFL